LIGMRWIGLAGFLIACGGDERAPTGGEDCRIVRDEPARAVAVLREKYGDARKVATVVEACVAPTGTPCERVGKIAGAVPGLMPPATRAVPDPERTCASLPPAMQQCMLPSYALVHPVECDVIRTAVVQGAVEVPSNADIRAALGAALDDPGGPACADVRISITVDTLTYGRGGITTMPRHDGAIDADTLRAGLAALAKDCIGGIVLTADPGVGYKELISVMDLAMAVGLTKITLDTPSPSAPAAPAPAPSAPPAPATGSAAAPVIAVSKDAVFLDGRRIGGLDDVRATVTAALKALNGAGGKVILQADAQAPYGVISDVIHGARDAGYDNLAFATQ
jgi:biopolymer transport protein ExbD